MKLGGDCKTMYQIHFSAGLQSLPLCQNEILIEVRLRDVGTNIDQ